MPILAISPKESCSSFFVMTDYFGGIASSVVSSFHLLSSGLFLDYFHNTLLLQL